MPHPNATAMAHATIIVSPVPASPAVIFIAGEMCRNYDHDRPLAAAAIAP